MERSLPRFPSRSNDANDGPVSPSSGQPTGQPPVKLSGGVLATVVALLLSDLLLASPAPLAGQDPLPAQHGDHEALTNLRTAVLGTYGWEVTTATPEAQAFFDQGMQFLYSFSMGDAAISFREAQRLDPGCAICFWGEAVALGPNLNAGMRPASAPDAYAAAQEAARLANEGTVTPVERALSEAIAVRYTPEHDAVQRPALDLAYAEAMAAVHEAFPSHPEVATAYADALMLVDTRRGAYSLDDPSVRRIHELLEGVLARDITHPGACHLYIHATEATDQPEKAEPCADHLGTSVPGSSHMNHMPSHTYNRIGRWGDAVQANIEAWHSDQRAAWGDGLSYGAAHNLHMLLFSASFDGQGGIAAQAARDYSRMVSGGEFYLGQVLIRFGRFHEVLELRNPPSDPVNRALWDFSLGYAHLGLGAPDSAAVYLDGIQSTIASLPEDARWGRPGGSASFREAHAAADILGAVSGILEGEILRAEGRLDEAIAAFERAVAHQDHFGYDEPEPLVFAARHWLGAALLEAGRPEEAERVYLDSLDQHLHNGWALFGLEQALRDQGRTEDADRALERFLDAWTRSDTLLRASRF